jgi:uncharacterized membrane protein YhaH (DUF805 family)
MTFTQAIASGFQNYVNFNGRAARSEFWYWFLFTVLVSIAAGLGDGVLAVSIRRLHDLDRSGWWYLLIFIPLIGLIVLLVWYCTRGTVGSNRFGPDPVGGAP